MASAIAIPPFELFRNCLYKSVGEPSLDTSPIFFRYGIIAFPVPPFIRRMLLTKSVVTLSGVEAAFIFSRQVVIDPGVAKYGKFTRIKSLLYNFFVQIIIFTIIIPRSIILCNRMDISLDIL